MSAGDHPVWVRTCMHAGCVITADHTHGATAGTTPDGRPWLAMDAATFDTDTPQVQADLFAELEPARVRARQLDGQATLDLFGEATS